MSASTETSDPGRVVTNAHRIAMIVAGSMFASVLVFVGFVELAVRGLIPVGTTESDATVIRYTFFGISIALVFAINVIRSIMLRTARTDDPAQLTARLTSTSVITAGLAESPAIMGFVLFLGWGYYADFYLLTLIAFYLLARHFPRRSQWEAFVRGHTD